MDYLFKYLLFLGEAITIVVSIAAVLILFVGLMQRGRQAGSSEHLEIKPLNKRFDDMKLALEHQLLSPLELKARHKRERKEEKAKDKAEKKALKQAADEGGDEPAAAEDEEQKKRVFVVDFNGDVRASQVTQLREEITALLTIATANDEVVVKLESPGGMVHGYGLAASQLVRVRQRDIPLTVVVDKVAASGGYMMACVADKVIAAPFAIIGSIGVVMQVPNFHRLLKKNDVDVEMMTAGEYKRTLTVLGENTDADRAKVQQELDETHSLFKDFITEHRQQVDMSKVATGEHWYGKQALALELVDELQTSDDYLLAASKDSDLYQVRYHGKKSLAEKIMGQGEEALMRVLGRA